VVPLRRRGRPSSSFSEKVSRHLHGPLFYPSDSVHTLRLFSHSALSLDFAVAHLPTCQQPFSSLWFLSLFNCAAKAFGDGENSWNPGTKRLVFCRRTCFQVDLFFLLAGLPVPLMDPLLRPDSFVIWPYSMVKAPLLHFLCRWSLRSGSLLGSRTLFLFPLPTIVSFL